MGCAQQLQADVEKLRADVDYLLKFIADEIASAEAEGDVIEAQHQAFVARVRQGGAR